MNDQQFATFPQGKEFQGYSLIGPWIMVLPADATGDILTCIQLAKRELNEKIDTIVLHPKVAAALNPNILDWLNRSKITIMTSQGINLERGFWLA